MRLAYSNRRRLVIGEAWAHQLLDPGLVYWRHLTNIRVLTVSYTTTAMPLPLGAWGIMFSGCPSARHSVRQSIRQSVDRPTPRWLTNHLVFRPLVRPSVPRGFWKFFSERMGGNGLKFGKLIYPDKAFQAFTGECVGGNVRGWGWGYFRRFASSSIWLYVACH